MKLINKGEILSDGVDDIYNIIFKEYTHKGFCDIDFEGIKAITTKFAGKLFGRLYDNLGKEEFYKNKGGNLCQNLSCQRTLKVIQRREKKPF